MIDLSCSSGEDNETLRQQAYNLSETSRWLPHNFSREAVAFDDFSKDPLALSLLEQKCLYLVDKDTARNWTYQAPSSGILGTGELEVYGAVTCEGMNVKKNGTFICSGFDGPPITSQLYNNATIELEHVQSIFANISDVLTAWIRTHPNETNSNPAVGEVLHHATCLQVQWGWIAFPAALAISTFVFFVLVALETARQELPVWKLSPLAWILRGPRTIKSLRGAAEASVSAMEENSKRMVVTLVREPDPKVQLARVSAGEERATKRKKEEVLGLRR
jgi:hypothetical protein